MSKLVKDLITKELRKRLDGVEDALLVDVIGLENNKNILLRQRLRKKNMHLLVVKNSLARRATEGTSLAPAFETTQGTMAIVWGVDDHVVPVQHAEVVGALASDARVEIFNDAGHFPHKDDPERFIRFLTSFIAETKPAVYRRANIRRLLLTGGTPTVAEARKRQLVVVPGAVG